MDVPREPVTLQCFWGILGASTQVRAESTMMKRILVATDGSADAMAAERFLGALALRAGTTLRVVVVAEETAWYAPDWMKTAQQKWADAVAGEAVSTLKREGIEVTHSIRHGAPAYEILEAAAEFDADLVALGSKSQDGMDRFSLGAVAANVARHALCPVLIARAPRNELRQVVLAVDESESATHAVAFASELPLPGEAEIVAAHVLCRQGSSIGALFREPYPFPREVLEAQRRRKQAAEERVEAVRDRLRAAGKKACSAVLSGDPATEILKLAEERRADLVIAGARGVSLIRGLVVGSVADRLLKSATCSVLLVR